MKFNPLASILVLCCILCTNGNKDSYSYYRFNGPVSGKIEEVHFDAGTKKEPEKKDIDFMAKPDYSYAYGIDDPNSGSTQIHKESREGDSVLGEYRIVQPDGLLRIVRYIANSENGFQVDVQYVPINPTKEPTKQQKPEDEPKEEE